MDNTTNDWIVLNGQESNGWTAIQFKRLLDTCDSMDYPIKVFYHFFHRLKEHPFLRERQNPFEQTSIRY